MLTLALASILGLDLASVAAAEGPQSSPGTFKFDAASPAQVLEIYQELSGRTILRSASLPTNRISLPSEKGAARPEGLAQIEAELRGVGIVVVPIGDRFAAVLPAGQTNRLTSLPPPPTFRRSSAPVATEVLPAGMIRFAEADIHAIAEVWQELSGRMVFLPSTIPQIPISLRSQTELTREQAAWLLDAAMSLAGFAVVSSGDRFAFVLPAGQTNDWPRFDREAMQAKAMARYGPTTEWKLRNIDLAELSRAYASITLRRAAALPNPIPPVRFTINSQTALDQAESIYALEAAAWAHGFRFETSGVNQFSVASVARSVPPRTLVRTEGAIREDLERKRKQFGDDDPAVAEVLMELGGSLARSNAPASAEVVYREALKILQARWTADLVKLERPILAVANVLLTQGKAIEMEQFLDGFLTAENDARPGASTLRRWRGDYRARRSRWKEATADFQLALDGNGLDHRSWSALGPLLIEQGNLDGYRAHRSLMLARFRSSTNAVPAEQIARAALLLPSEGHGLSVSRDLAQTALARGTNLPMPFAERLARIVGSQGTNATNRTSRRSTFSERLAAIVQIAATNQTNSGSVSSTKGGPTTRSTSFTQRLEQIASSPDVASYVNSTNGRRALVYYGGRSAIFFTMGLAEYRAGRFTNAVAWMQQANASSTGLPPSLLDGQLQFVLAMALFGDGQFAQAHAALAEGVRFVQAKLPAATDADPGTYWDQVLMTRILMREAKATIEQPASRPAVAP